MQRITALGHQAVDRPARGQQVTDLRARDRRPAGRRPTTARQPGGTSAAAAGRPRHDGQGDQAPQIVGAVPGCRARAPGRRPTTRNSSSRAAAGLRPGPPRPCPPSSWGRPGRSRAGWPRRRGSPRPGPRSARSGPRRARPPAAPTSATGSLATTRSRRSRPSASMAARAAATCPTCGGSNVPPRIPIARRAAQVPASSAITGASASISASCTTM